MEMNSKFWLPALFLSLSIFSSCVSNKKYNEAQRSAKNKQEALTNCERELSTERNMTAQLTNEIKDLKSSTTESLAKKQIELYQKENLIKEREKVLADMKEELNVQRDALLNLKQEVCSALKCFTPDELSIEIREGKLYVSISDKLLFPSGSEVVNERGKEAIAMLANVLAQSNLEIMVEGHTDPVPINTMRNKDNWDLSVHRATSVTRLLIEEGIAPERIISGGRAEFHPIVSNDTEMGKRLNRRTEIVLSPKLDKLWKLTEEPSVSASTGK